MNISLGNLTIKQMEERAGIVFPEKLVNILKDTREEMCAKIKGRRVWHCFDIPFSLCVGDKDFAKEIYEHLKPLSSEFKEIMSISVDV